MSRLVYESNINGEFMGFNDAVLFKMKNGTYWLQAQYKYWYRYAFSPEATINEENGSYILTIDGQSVPIKRVNDVIESQIDGAFKGWEGKSSYKPQNGQVWHQCTYKYGYMPKAIVYPTSSGYKMQVAGTTADVSRER